MTTPRRLTTTLVLAAVTALTLAGCSADDDGGGSPGGSGDGATSADRGVDASSYVEDYAEGAGDQFATSSSGGTVAAPPAAEPGSPGPLTDDTFVDHGVSGSVDTRLDPESTFALDVDTGSYSVARTLLADGVRPPAASIRPEEWVNSFDYDDPAPADDDLAVSTETGVDPSTDSQLVKVAVTSRALAAEDRPRAHITLVVDRSGSMDMQNRLGLVKASLGVLANELRDDDTVSVVSFDDEATPILDPTRASDTDALESAIDRLEPGGSTNLEAGMRLGYDQARASYERDAVNVVVLCSDGVANVGDTMPDSITDTIAEEGSAGIHLVTVGFGMGNYNDHLMEQLADTGDGFYSYVDTFDEAERLFGTELTTTLVPVAAEARAQVRFDPAAVTTYRLIGYEDRALADNDFEDLSVDAGELGPGHHATALYAVTLAPTVPDDTVIGSAEVRWASVASGSARSSSASIRSAASASPSPGFELASAVADTALALKGDPALSLSVLEDRVSALAAHDVPGASELLDVIRSAEGTTYGQ